MVIPASFDGIPLGGQSSAVIFLDADGTFDIARLHKTLQNLVSLTIARASGGLTTRPTIADVEAVIETALQHVHVFRPQSMTSLIATIESLPDYLFSSGRHYSAHRRVGAIILDSATAFYWNDRHESEVSRITDRTGDGGLLPAYTRLRHALLGLSQEMSCSIVYTAANLFHKVVPGRERALQSSLPSSWSSFPTLRLIVARRLVRGLPTAVSADEAVRDAGHRAEVVAQGVFDVCLNDNGATEWERGVQERLRSSGGSRFGLLITADGVVVGQS